MLHSFTQSNESPELNGDILVQSRLYHTYDMKVQLLLDAICGTGMR